MKHAVITGSTRGIGYGLAEELLARGCQITLNGRTNAAVEDAQHQLAARYGEEQLYGHPADVTRLHEVEALWEKSLDRFGKVDIWINNAGIGHALSPMWEIPVEELAEVVAANVLGVMYGSRVAIRGMLEQGYGQLYNMLGFGSKGNTRHGMSAYGASKAAVSNLTKALIGETRDTPVQIGSLSPGMVATDFLLDRLRADPELLARSKRIMNLLTDRVETVTPWLADKLLANDKTDTHIEWLTAPKILGRFLKAPLSRRDIFGELLEQRDDA